MLQFRCTDVHVLVVISNVLVAISNVQVAILNITVVMLMVVVIPENVLHCFENVLHCSVTVVIVIELFIYILHVPRAYNLKATTRVDSSYHIHHYQEPPVQLVSKTRVTTTRH